MTGSRRKTQDGGARIAKIFAPISDTENASYREAKAEWVRRLLLPSKRRVIPRRGRIATSAWIRNVAGIAIGEKIADGRHTGVRSIRFLVERKYPNAEVASKHRLPKTIDGLLTDVEEIGIPRAFAGSVPDPKTEVRPAQPGCSVGFKDPKNESVMAGTFGALVTDGTELFILSNNHVLADLDFLPSGEPIFQPGLADDLNDTGHKIAEFTRSVPLSEDGANDFDCAIARVINRSKVSRDILFIGPPAGTTSAREQSEVHKFGRSTRYTVGRITSLDSAVRLRMASGKVFLFEHQVVIESLNSKPFSDDGDSGALVLERSTQLAVGLIIGGTSKVSFANHLPEALDKLTVRLVLV